MQNSPLTNRSRSLLWLLLVGALNLVASGRWTVAAATWLAPVFALRYLDAAPRGRRAWRAFALLYLVTWLTLTVAWYNATPMFGLAHVIFMAVNALVGLLPLLADFWLTPRLAQNGRLPFITTLIYPSAATAVEYVLLGSSPFGNFGAAGYSQTAFVPFVQIGAWGGMALQSFLLAWLPAIVVWVWRNAARADFAWSQVRAGLLIGVLTYVLLLGAGALRLLTAPATSAETVQIAAFTVASPDLPLLFGQLEREPDAFAATMQAQHAAYLARTDAEGAAGAQIVLWPEAAVIGRADEVDAVLAAGSALAQTHDLYLAMPTFTVYPGEQRPPENRLIVVDPSGAVVLNHVKFGGNIVEGSLAGSGELQTVETPYGTLSGVICWDTDFPNVIRQAGRQGVDILLSPARDFAGINPLHGQMTAFRAIENGLTVVRQADSGLSLISDPYGRPMASVAAGSDATLRANVPTQGIPTLYAQLGDAVGLVATLLFAGLAVYAFAAGRRRAAQPLPLADQPA